MPATTGAPTAPLLPSQDVRAIPAVTHTTRLAKAIEGRVQPRAVWSMKKASIGVGHCAPIRRRAASLHNLMETRRTHIRLSAETPLSRRTRIET